MDNEKYFTCSFYKQQEFNIENNFLVRQKELLQDQSNRFKVRDVEYKCEWHRSNFLSDLPTLIVPIRDDTDLLNYTLTNFKEKGLLELANVIVVDDRSKIPLNKITKQFNVNYLRVDNEKGFNFSMLNNIPSYIVHKLGGKIALFWNSDLWIDKIEYFEELLSRHTMHSSTISGSKLLYPHQSLTDEDSINIKSHFPHMTDGRYKGTVQFGGARWFWSPHQESYIPIHYKRFADKDDFRVNHDTGTETVTGALQVIDLDWFINSGGFNPSLSKIFQDTDLCLRAILDDKKVMYFGKDIHFYHDESLNIYSGDEQKMDKQYVSDEILFAKIWSKKITNLIF